MNAECTATLTGKHMFTPKKIGENSKNAHKGETVLYGEYQCRCGAWPPDMEAVRAALKETADERRRQAEAAKRLTGVKRMESNEAPRLEGFEA